MEIETYEVEEHTTEGRDAFEIDAEAEALIESLGLEGQRALLHPSDDPDVQTKTRLPYRQMTIEEQRVYGVLYPEKSKIEDYDAGPIPLRVLQVIAHARPLFDRLGIWGPRMRDTDPVLVGVAKRPTQFGGTEDVLYLLARWGDALAPFEELRERAVDRLTKQWKAKAEQVAAECMAFMDAPAHSVNRYFEGEWVHEPYTT